MKNTNSYHRISSKEIAVTLMAGLAVMFMIAPLMVGAQPNDTPVAGNVDANFNSVRAGQGITPPEVAGLFQGGRVGIIGYGTDATDITYAGWLGNVGWEGTFAGGAFLADLSGSNQTTVLLGTATDAIEVQKGPVDVQTSLRNELGMGKDAVLVQDSDGLNIADDVGTVNIVATGDTGRVGIGTTNPQNRLDVAGSVVIGQDFAGTLTGVENGLQVQGDVGINVAGDWDSSLHVQGTGDRTTIWAYDEGWDNISRIADKANGHGGYFSGLNFGVVGMGPDNWFGSKLSVGHNVTDNIGITIDGINAEISNPNINCQNPYYQMQTSDPNLTHPCAIKINTGTPVNEASMDVDGTLQADRFISEDGGIYIRDNLIDTEGALLSYMTKDKIHSGGKIFAADTIRTATTFDGKGLTTGELVIADSGDLSTSGKISADDGISSEGNISADGKITAGSIGTYTMRYNSATASSVTASCNAGEIAVSCGASSGTGVKTVRHQRYVIGGNYIFDKGTCYAYDGDAASTIFSYAWCLNTSV